MKGSGVLWSRVCILPLCIPAVSSSSSSWPSQKPPIHAALVEDQALCCVLYVHVTHRASRPDEVDLLVSSVFPLWGNQGTDMESGLMCHSQRAAGVALNLDCLPPRPALNRTVSPASFLAGAIPLSAGLGGSPDLAPFSFPSRWPPSLFASHTRCCFLKSGSQGQVF